MKGRVLTLVRTDNDGMILHWRKRRYPLQVMKFWGKAERVVAYKNKSAADARKKEVMDKHLNFLVGQTQRYSSMLAQRLNAGVTLSIA